MDREIKRLIVTMMSIWPFGCIPMHRPVILPTRFGGAAKAGDGKVER